MQPAGRMFEVPDLQQEYQNVTDEESICRSAQETLNLIIDYNRETYKNIPQEEYESDKT